MKISFITTVFNEEKTISKFLESLISQSKLPHEIVIVDGGSSDATVTKVKKFTAKLKRKKIPFTILIKQGNRSVGRNEAIKHATGDIIVCSDAGNILDRDWIKNIVKPFKDSSVDVVAGYYKGLPKNIFQKCLVTYALVMPDKVDPDNFLPATRSVAFTKKIWKKVGRFDEQLSHNEDYVFANRLKEKKAKIVFAKDAIVYWLPRSTYKEAFVMFFRFALGDAEAGIWRSNVLLLFSRYFLGFYFLFLSLLYRSFVPLFILLVGFIFYIFWSVKKNERYVKEKKAFLILPLLQFTADAAVISGSLVGLVKRIRRFDYFLFTKNNAFLIFIIVAYVAITVWTLNWGIPSQFRLFPYHMDEWHQLQAVANTFRYGTPNIAGSANGTLFHFLLTGFYLIPFTALHIINPFELQIDNWFMRERVFEVLRLNTILWGVLSIFLLYKIADLIRASKKLAIVLFTFTPIWLMLSGYFKYDIALIFWILLAVFSFFRFGRAATYKNFLLAAIPVGLSIAVKVSAIPLLPAYVFTYFLFQKKKLWSYRHLLGGIMLVLGIILLFGMPDSWLGRGNVIDYLYNNIIESPSYSSNFILWTDPLLYLFVFQYPILFGYGLMFFFLLSLVIGIGQFLRIGFRKSFRIYKTEILLFFMLVIFVCSLIPLQIWAGGNRSLVLLPFFVLISSLVFKKLYVIQKIRKWLLLVTGCVVILQLYFSYGWVSLRMISSPQERASQWIEKNIPSNAVIGVENIPIYQGLPDMIVKEFYLEQYEVKQQGQFAYQVISSKSQTMPEYVVVTNDQVEKKLLKISPKNDLVDRLEREGYEKRAVFTPFDTLNKVSDVDYYFSWLLAAPQTVSVFEKSTK